MIYKLSIFTQYGQFYIADSSAEGDTGNPNFWDDEALNARLAIADGIVGVSIENDEAIANIELELLNSGIKEDRLTQFDHVAECSLLIKSGKLQILDCPNWQVELELDVEPNWYKVRVGCSNLDKARQENPADKYYIKIWKENQSERKVIKRWHSS
jgi:hypothetical protein